MSGTRLRPLDRFQRAGLLCVAVWFLAAMTTAVRDGDVGLGVAAVLLTVAFTLALQ